MSDSPLRLVLPKGRIGIKVLSLLKEAGYRVEGSDRSYRPTCSVEGVEVKLLKPQNIPQLLSLGRHDVGFSGHDWVREHSADVADILDTGFDPVRIVAAVPRGLENDWMALGRPIVVATEYVRIAEDFLRERELKGIVVRTYGATEVFPPEDADIVIDNCATGETLRQNNLVIVETVLRSSTRMLVSPAARGDESKQARIADLKALCEGVLRARRKVLLEMNVGAENLEALVAALPAMRSPTVAPLHKGQGFAVKIAVDKDAVAALIPVIRALGATDVIEYGLKKILP